MPTTTSASPGWRTGYEGYECFPRQAFAWEYLRRNEVFHEVCRNDQRRRRMQTERLRVIDGGSAKQWRTCLFAASVNEDARSATVLWNPRVCPKVLPLLALPVRKGTKPFVLTDTAVETTLLVTKDRIQHVLIREGLRNLQLHVRGESLLRPVTLAFDTAVSPLFHTYQLQLLSCFQAYQAGQGLLERFSPKNRYAIRLTFVLRALDGWLAGVSQREIATALYGHDRVDRNWRDPRENLRDQVRHAIARGRALMDHGYAAFLR